MLGLMMVFSGQIVWVNVKALSNYIKKLWGNLCGFKSTTDGFFRPSYSSRNIA